MSEDSVTAGVETDPLYFENCYPDPNDEFNHGGWPGVVYSYVAVANMKRYTKNGWWVVPNVDPVSNGNKVYTIAGPNGTVDCVVMGYGDPIRGSEPAGGLRDWRVDPDLERGTGVEAYPGSLAEESKDAPSQGKKQEGDKREHQSSAA